jgi:uncharacterized membrane protein YbhN (UPF0104 family)
MKKRALQIIQTLLTIALIGIVAWKANDFLLTVDWNSIPAIWLQVIAAALLFLLGYIMLAEHWLLVAREIVPDLPAVHRLAFFASQPYKYLPTSFFTLSFRAHYAKKLGMSLKDSTKAQLIENINIVSGALLLGTITWFLMIDARVGIGLVVVLAIFFGLLWKYHHVDMHVGTAKLKLHMRCWIRGYLIVLAAWFVVGIGFYVLASALQPDVTWLKAIAATDYAFAAGIVAVFAPGGIGVRELVFTSFEFVASTVVVWRCITFVIDIVLGVVTIGLIARRQK